MLDLWLPTLLSAVAVFIASSVIHMVTSFHKNDYPAPPSQDALGDAIRPFNIPPGDYMIPHPVDMKDMATPEFKAKVERGPKIVFTVMPNVMTAMGPLLLQWFIYCLVINALAGCVACLALPGGTEYMLVFKTVALAAFLGYAGALWQGHIWFGKGLGITLRGTVDAVIYALITAGFFGWLWPR